ncbi:MAG: hypothetical protein ACLP0J_01180 [Solirubrobacteraceae bacterium]
MADQDVLVWRYGSRNGVEVPPCAEEQLLLAHELREHLVELAHRREAATQHAWGEHPQVADAIAARDSCQQQVAGALDQAAEERKHTRQRTISRELRERIITARRDARAAKAAVRDAKAAAYATVAPLLHQARDDERQAQKTAYGEYVQQRGLYWATYNRILEQHKIADRRVGAQRQHQAPAQLRHHRYDGTGRLAVQLQRAKHQPARTADLLSSADSPWRNVLRIPAVCAADPDEWAALTRAEQRHAGRQHINMRLTAGRDPSYWDLPVQVHRPLPPGAEVVGAEIVITRIAGKRRISVNLTLRTPKAAPAQGGTVAVDIGWRSMPDDSIRAGYWRASGQPTVPLRVPDHLREVLRVTHAGQEGEIRIPASWRQLDERLHQLHGGRDTDLNRLKPEVARWLAEHPAHADALQTAPADVGRWRSPARMVTLARQLAEYDHEADILPRLRTWERQDRHLWQWEANERDQLIARRRDAYRAIAALLTAAWPHVILERAFVSQVTRRPIAETADSHQAEHARSQARLAAPAEFAQAIAAACGRRGGNVTEFDPKLTTRRHHLCGIELPGDIDTARRPIVHCPTCDLDYDQDQNAVLNMLREWSGAGPNPEQRTHQHFQAKPTTHHTSTPAKRAA